MRSAGSADEHAHGAGGQRGEQDRQRERHTGADLRQHEPGRSRERGLGQRDLPDQPDEHHERQGDDGHDHRRDHAEPVAAARERQREQPGDEERRPRPPARARHDDLAADGRPSASRGSAADRRRRTGPRRSRRTGPPARPRPWPIDGHQLLDDSSVISDCERAERQAARARDADGDSAGPRSAQARAGTTSSVQNVGSRPTVGATRIAIVPPTDGGENPRDRGQPVGRVAEQHCASLVLRGRPGGEPGAGEPTECPQPDGKHDGDGGEPDAGRARR